MNQYLVLENFEHDKIVGNKGQTLSSEEAEGIPPSTLKRFVAIKVLEEIAEPTVKEEAEVESEIEEEVEPEFEKKKSKKRGK